MSLPLFCGPPAIRVVQVRRESFIRAAVRMHPGFSQEHAVVVEATVGPQDGDIALKLRFNKQPWGLECGNRCANATVLIDTGGKSPTASCA